jgi:hypothetical protein
MTSRPLSVVAQIYVNKPGKTSKNLGRLTRNAEMYAPGAFYRAPRRFFSRENIGGPHSPRYLTADRGACRFHRTNYLFFRHDDPRPTCLGRGHAPQFERGGALRIRPQSRADPATCAPVQGRWTARRGENRGCPPAEKGDRMVAVNDFSGFVSSI